MPTDPGAGELLVLTLPAVKAGIKRLQDQRIHEHFPGYVHLRQRAEESGSLSNIEPDWDSVSQLLWMPSGPPRKPHYRPFSSRTLHDPSGYWYNPNLAGSYAPSSIRSTASFLLNASGDGYALPPDNAQKALATMLNGVKIPAWALAAYFLRNDGFEMEGPGSVADLIIAFKAKFLFTQGSDFDVLFNEDAPIHPDVWFEPLISRNVTEQNEESHA